MSTGLRISLAANLALIGAIGVLLWRRQAERRPSPPPAAVASGVLQRPEESSRSVAGIPPAASGRIDPAAVSQLERMGISREVLVSALLEDFNRRWDRRLMEVQKKYAPRQPPEREFIELARLRDAEQMRELKAALGEEGYLAWDKERTLRQLNTAGLPMTPDEAERAYRLQKEFDEKHRELQMAIEDGVADMADGSALQAQAQEALDRELENLFGKQRLNEMRGTSDALSDVYWRFGDLNPTADQARAVLQTEADHRAREAALARRLHESPADTATLLSDLKVLHETRDQSLRQLFGAEAYDAMKRQSDQTYKTLRQYAAAWELKDDEVQSVYQSLRAFQEQAERTRSVAAMREAAGQRVNWQEIDAGIEQSRQQTEAGLQSLIGNERLRRLKQNGLLSTR